MPSGVIMISDLKTETQVSLSGYIANNQSHKPSNKLIVEHNFGFELSLYML